MKKFKFLIIGFLIGSFFFGGVVRAVEEYFNVKIFNVRFIFNNQEKAGSDKPYMYKNGPYYVPIAFIYSGTTYVPIRYVSETLGQPVKYFAKQGKIFIGEIPDGDFMSDILKPVTFKDLVFLNTQIKVKDTVFDSGYKMQCFEKENTATFNLSGKYSKITGYIGLDVDALGTATVRVYKDETLIYETMMFQIDPASRFEWYVTGGQVLTIKVLDVNADETMVDIGDPIIK